MLPSLPLVPSSGRREPNATFRFVQQWSPPFLTADEAMRITLQKAKELAAYHVVKVNEAIVKAAAASNDRADIDFDFDISSYVQEALLSLLKAYGYKSWFVRDIQTDRLTLWVSWRKDEPFAPAFD